MYSITIHVKLRLKLLNRTDTVLNFLFLSILCTSMNGLPLMLKQPCQEVCHSQIIIVWLNNHFGRIELN